MGGETKMKIVLASDHAGFELKEKIKNFLQENGYPFSDLGTGSTESVNWAEYGARGAREVARNPEKTKGILICGTGIGMSIVANKFKGIRAALCLNPHMAEMSRKHNNANILTLGARILKGRMAIKIVKTWLNTEFEGGRHQKRLDDLHRVIEKQNFRSHE
jgi:ribose 5-phosphate isomerase B